MNRVLLIPKRVETKVSIPFEQGGRSFVNVGDEVNFGQLLYELDRKSIKESYHLPALLGIKAEHSGDYVGRISGEYIVTGDLLAERITAGGMIGKQVVAGTDGVISLVRLKQGYIDILGEQESVQVESKVKGVVEEISMGRSITLRGEAGQLTYSYSTPIRQHLSPITGELSGELAILGDGTSVYTAKDLQGSYEGRVLLAGRFVYEDLAREIYRRGAIAVIVNSMDYQAVKGVDFPLILLSGFGQISLEENLASIFQNSAGNLIKISPDDSSLLILNQTGVSPDTFKGHSYFTPSVSAGDLVKISDPVHFGSVGRVIELMDDDLKAVVELGKKRLLIETSSLTLYIANR